jgi:RND family efflux transporter MFP subunit
MRSRVMASVVLGLFAAAALAQPPGGGPPPASVVFDAARMETVEQYRPVTGELQAVRRALLAAEEEGLVIEVIPEQGDAVKSGDVVARLRDTKARLDVDRARADLGVKQATVKEREAELVRAEQDLERVQTLTSQSSANWKELEDRKALVATARARVQAVAAEVSAAEADLSWTQEQLARMTIVAPFDGRVITKRTEVGQWLKKGDGVVELLAMDQIDARLDVPERLIQRLTDLKEAVRITLQATGETFQAPVTAIIPEADPRSRLIPVRVRVANSEGKLRPGMSILGLVPSGSREPALTIHKDAILRDDAGEYVFFDRGGMAAVARVRSLFPAPGGRVAVESATLPKDANIVIEGNERLFPGAPIGGLPQPKAAETSKSDQSPALAKH